MSSLYPRLLVNDFPACFRFYREVLPRLVGASLARGDEVGFYASWDVGTDTTLALLVQSAMSDVAGTAPTDAGAAMLVIRVDDIDAAARLCEQSGATIAAPATDRPEWGPTMRTAHVRDPDGNLIELQSY